jgi:ribosomal RNA assembly protein
MKETILIPKERIAVLIGKSGTSRRSIEQKGKVKLWVDSNTNEVSISGTVNNIYFAKKVVELVGRGFSPKSALKLYDEKFSAELCDVTDFGVKERKDRKRMLARIIGTKGKSKNIIEKETNTEIVIYGKTIGILGKPEDVEQARRAIEALLQGSEYGSAFRLLK